jgi:hypothetical protein
MGNMKSGLFGLNRFRFLESEKLIFAVLGNWLVPWCAVEAVESC